MQTIRPRLQWLLRHIKNFPKFLVRPRTFYTWSDQELSHPRTSSSNQPNLTWVICTVRFDCHGYQRLRNQSSHQGKPRVQPVPNFKAVSAICRPSQHCIKDLDGIKELQTPGFEVPWWHQHRMTTEVLTKRLNLFGVCYCQGPDISHRTLRKHLSWAFTFRSHQGLPHHKVLGPTNPPPPGVSQSGQHTKHSGLNVL